MSANLHRILERLLMICMGGGIVSMFQPWLFGLFSWGFLLLLLSTIGFTIISNVQVKETHD